MSMFDTYDNTNAKYIPNNISKNPAKDYEVIDNSLPRKLYDIKNRFIGYCWDFGDEFDFVVSVNDKIKVRRDSIVFNEEGKEPTTATVGYKGLQAYNTIDNKSWTCIGLIDGFYVWVPDDNVTYAVDGTTELEMIRDTKGKTVRVDFYDFRWEHIKSFENSSCNAISCRIDKDIYELMKSGVYYCTVKVLGIDECDLIDKFEIVIN